MDETAPEALRLRLEEAARADDGGQARVTAATRRRLLAILRSEGYYGAQVRSTVHEGAPAFTIIAGPQFQVGAVTVQAGGDAAAAELAASADLIAVGAPLQAPAVLAAEAAGLAALQDRGWPDARLGERQVQVDHATGQGAVTLVYEPGAFSRIGALRPQTDLLNDSLLHRLSPFAEGKTAQLSGLQRYQDRLARLESVSSASVRLAPPQPGTDQRDVLISLSPAPRHVLEAGLRFSTSEGGGVDAAWTRRNLFDRDDRVVVAAEAATLVQALDVRFSAPHWRRLDQTLTLSAGVRNEETDAYDQQEAAVAAELSRPIRVHWTASGQLGLDLSRLRSDGDVRDSAAVSLRLGAAYDDRDSLTDPTRGLRASASAAPTVALGGFESAYVIGDASLRAYRRLGGGMVAAGRVRAGSILGAGANAAPLDDRFYAGGGGSVRGFDYQALSPRDATGDLVGGRSLLETSAELRWRSAGRWGAVVFADAGQAGRDVTPDMSDLRVGVGVGLRYHFDFAPVRFDIAAPVDRQADEASLHVYIGLGQAF